MHLAVGSLDHTHSDPSPKIPKKHTVKKAQYLCEVTQWALSWAGDSIKIGAAQDTYICDPSSPEVMHGLVLCAESKPRVKALTLSQIEARVEDPTIALKQLIKEHK